MPPPLRQKFSRTTRSRRRIWNLGRGDLQVSEIKLSHTEIEDQLESLRRQLNTDGDRKSLESLDLTQDRWKAHALILRDAAHDSPNIAILTTPYHWKSLTEKIRLHAFARVEGIDIDALHKELDRDYNYNPINSLARYILPKTPESEFRSLLPRFPL
ncbi:hypothetical protein [Sporisorium scitamineum]|uniref:Uncharacterized protein n=1 Tax=Sporisorium scitamineum TaxID=49012 RepID=A0A0F7S6H7_9BASI|nr:hypothetical protein [Sporisorium scitamineum]